jgi:phage tail sheath gpL-like
MPISFSNIPALWRIPLYYVEVDPSKAGLPVNRLPTVLVGHMVQTGLESGNAAVDVPIPVASQAQADEFFGLGSQLACMFEVYFKNNWAQEVWGLPVAEGSTAATKTVTVTNPPTAAGTLHLYIAGRHVPVPISAGQTVAQVATAIMGEVNELTSLPVTANAVAAIVTLTCKGKGTYGTDITVITNYYSAVGGEVTPAGLSISIANGVAGAGDPLFTTAISNLGEMPSEYVCMPFTDSNSLLAWKTEFGFSDTGRWGWVRQLYGHVFSAKRDTYGNLLTWGPAGGGNNATLSVMAVEVNAPNPVWEWCAAYTGKASRALSIDPARPLQSLHLEGVLPARGQDRFLLSQLNALSTAGLATQRTLQDGVPMITRETTTYLYNLYGNTDDAYTDVTTLATLAKLLRNQRQAITSKYPRHKLANDGTRFGAGQAIVTPKTIKAELVAQYRMDEFLGLVEDAIAFKNNLIVERDPNDPNRINVLYPPDLVNQLRIFAVLAQFRLQYNRGVDLAIV